MDTDERIIITAKMRLAAKEDKAVRFYGGTSRRLIDVFREELERGGNDFQRECELLRVMQEVTQS